MTYPPYGQQRLDYPPMAPWRAPPSPSKTAPLLWLSGGLVALLVASGITLVLLLQDQAPGVVADPPTQSDPGNGGGSGPVSPPREVPTPPTDCLVECADPDPPGGPDAQPANYTRSDEAALGFVQALAGGDPARAHAALCGPGLSRFATPEDLVADFYATFGITMIAGADLTGVYAADSTADAAVFELQTDSGDPVVEVYVVQEGASLTVCGYDIR